MEPSKSPNEDVRSRLLVLRYQAGDREALEELVQIWQGRLHFYIRRMVGNESDAWQILQDVWVKVLTGIHRLQDEGRLAPWLYAVTRNTIMSHRRQLFRQPGETAELPAESLSDERPSQQQRETAEEIHFGLSQLQLVDREVLTLFFLQDLGTIEIGEVLGIPRGTVKSRLHTARNRLREVLTKRGNHE